MAIDQWDRTRALQEAIADRNVWIGDGEFDPDAFIIALERSGYTVADARQCADCGYPLGDHPVLLGGVWFCAACNPAISR